MRSCTLKGLEGTPAFEELKHQVREIKLENADGTAATVTIDFLRQFPHLEKISGPMFGAKPTTAEYRKNNISVYEPGQIWSQVVDTEQQKWTFAKPIVASKDNVDFLLALKEIRYVNLCMWGGEKVGDPKENHMETLVKFLLSSNNQNFGLVIHRKGMDLGDGSFTSYEGRIAVFHNGISEHNSNLLQFEERRGWVRANPTISTIWLEDGFLKWLSAENPYTKNPSLPTELMRDFPHIKRLGIPTSFELKGLRNVEFAVWLLRQTHPSYEIVVDRSA